MALGFGRFGGRNGLLVGMNGLVLSELSEMAAAQSFAPGKVREYWSVSISSWSSSGTTRIRSSRRSSKKDRMDLAR